MNQDILYCAAAVKHGMDTAAIALTVARDGATAELLDRSYTGHHHHHTFYLSS